MHVFIPQKVLSVNECMCSKSTINYDAASFSALHHSEGFGAASCRTDETLLQQPSLSWDQGRKRLPCILSTVSNALLLSPPPPPLLPPFLLSPAPSLSLSLSLSHGSVPSTMTEWIAMTHEIGGWCSV